MYFCLFVCVAGKSDQFGECNEITHRHKLCLVNRLARERESVSGKNGNAFVEGVVELNVWR